MGRKAEPFDLRGHFRWVNRLYKSICVTQFEKGRVTIISGQFIAEKTETIELKTNYLNAIYVFF